MEHVIGIGATVLLVGYFGLNAFVALLVLGGEGLIRALDGDETSPGERAILYAGILVFGVAWGVELIACLAAGCMNLADWARRIAVEIVCAAWVILLVANAALAAGYWRGIQFWPSFTLIAVVGAAVWMTLRLISWHLGMEQEELRAH